MFPSQIEEVLLNIEECGPHYEIVVDRKNHSDTLEIRVEVLSDYMMDSYAALQELEKKIKSKIRVVLGLDVKVSLVSPNSIQRFEGKAKRVIDLRKN